MHIDGSCNLMGKQENNILHLVACCATLHPTKNTKTSFSFLDEKTHHACTKILELINLLKEADQDVHNAITSLKFC